MVLADLDSYVQKNETHSPPYTIQKNKLKMKKDLNRSSDTTKVLEENIGRKISDIPHNNIFTDMSPTIRDIRERIHERDLMQKASAWLKKTPLK